METDIVRLKNILEVNLIMTRGELCLMEFAISELREKLLAQANGSNEVKGFIETLDRLSRRINDQIRTPPRNEHA